MSLRKEFLCTWCELHCKHAHMCLTHTRHGHNPSLGTRPFALKRVGGYPDHIWACFNKMATLATLPGIINFLTKRIVEERKSYAAASDELKSLNPNIRGLSTRSVRRFCAENGIHATSRLSDGQLDSVVATSISQVHTYMGSSG